MTRLGSWLLTAVLALGFLAVGWTWREPLLRRVLRSVYVVSEQSNPADVAVTLERIAAWDSTGIPLLVEALDGPRPEIRHTAQRLLLERSDLWRWPTTVESAQQLQTLADALADQVAKFQSPARLIAAELAARILRWPVDERYIDRRRMLAACERVLTAGQAPPAAETVAEYVPPSPITVAVRPAAGPSTEEPLSASQALAQRIQRQGWPRVESAQATSQSEPALPLKSPALEQTQAKIVLDGSMVVVPESASRAKLASTGESAPRVAAASQVERAVAETPVAPNGPQPGHSAAPTRRDEMVTPSSAVAPSPPTPVAEPPADDSDAYDLLVWLHSPDPTIRQRARHELTARGFKDRDFALAERLLHENARVRREFVGSLPGLTGVDSVVWLLWAARDSQAEIRLDALTILATMRDPQIMGQVRQLAAKDTDHRVRRLAEQIKTP